MKNLVYKFNVIFKILLGHELKSIMLSNSYSIKLKFKLINSFDANGQVICSEQNTQFIDNVIVIMRSVFGNENYNKLQIKMHLEGPTATIQVQRTTLGVPNNNTSGSSPSVVGSSSNDPSSNSSPSGNGRGGPQQINENPLATVNSLRTTCFKYCSLCTTFRYKCWSCCYTYTCLSIS